MVTADEEMAGEDMAYAARHFGKKDHRTKQEQCKRPEAVQVPTTTSVATAGRNPRTLVQRSVPRAAGRTHPAFFTRRPLFFNVDLIYLRILYAESIRINASVIRLSPALR